MSSFITHIQIKNFKSLRDCHLTDCKRINLLTGMAGKSNILEALSIFALPFLKGNPSKKKTQFTRGENEAELFHNGNHRDPVQIRIDKGSGIIEFSRRDGLEIRIGVRGGGGWDGGDYRGEGDRCEDPDIDNSTDDGGGEDGGDAAMIDLGKGDGGREDDGDAAKIDPVNGDGGEVDAARRGGGGCGGWGEGDRCEDPEIDDSTQDGARGYGIESWDAIDWGKGNHKERDRRGKDRRGDTRWKRDQVERDQFDGHRENYGWVPFIRKYSFMPGTKFEKAHSRHLIPPHGINLPTVIEGFPDLRREISDLLAEFGLELVIESNGRSLKVRRLSETGLGSGDKTSDFFLPYNSISETLQRVIFFKAAIASSEGAVLLFDGPEAHVFPSFLSHSVQDMIHKKDCQFFVATNSPYVLNELMEDCPEEVEVFGGGLKKMQLMLKLYN